MPCSSSGLRCAARARRKDARTVLREALELAQTRGALAVVARAEEELRAAGARPRRAALSGRDALTPGELRVAELAAEGLTNREIAAALYLSRRTVEHHVEHVLHKLGVGRRRDVAAALGTTPG